MFRWIFITASALVAFVLPVAGQENYSTINLVRDLPPGYDHAIEKKLEVRGLSLGMTRTDAADILVPLMPRARALASDAFNTVVGDGRGQVRQLRFLSTDRIEQKDGDSRELFLLQYGTPATGSRLSSILRSVSYSQKSQPLLDEVLSALTAKYGEPSFRSESFPYLYLTYVWLDGELQSGPAADLAAAKKCTSYISIEYHFARQRPAPSPGCTAVLTVSLTSGVTDRHLMSIQQVLQSPARHYLDATIADQWVVADMLREAAGTKVAPPAL
ncbi:hypothetical protein [Devosia sp.]|uniref:hypothetical protein n=1 Tax=Devosia sp. TaxID=1871048 RepID=UPI003F6F0D2E